MPYDIFDIYSLIICNVYLCHIQWMNTEKHKNKGLITLKKRNWWWWRIISVEFWYHRFQDQHEFGKQKQLPPARNSSAYQQQNFKNRSQLSFLFFFFLFPNNFTFFFPFYFILFLVFMFNLGFGYFLMCSLWEIGSSRKKRKKKKKKTLS